MLKITHEGTGPPAPYHSFAPRRFYNTVFVGGAYTAEIMGCNWQCTGCWSAYGWRGKGNGGLAPAAKRQDLSPQEAARRIVNGMKRNTQQMSRITGGEPLMHWDHTRWVVREVLDRTKMDNGMPARMKVEGAAAPEGEVFGIMIETNGSMLTPELLDELQAFVDDDFDAAKRVAISIGMKATSPELLADLTGLPQEIAKQHHERQLEAMWHLVKHNKMMVFVSFLEPWAEAADVARIQREVERMQPGAGRGVGTLPYSRNYAKADRLGFQRRDRSGS